MKLTRARLLTIVVLTTWAVAWIPAAVMAARGVPIDSPAGRALVVFQSFGPLVGALVGHALLPKGPTLGPLGITAQLNRFWLVAWLSPLLVAAVGITFAWSSGAELVLTAADLVRTKRALVPVADRAAWDAALRDHPMHAPHMLLLMALPAGLTVNVFPALAAEIGFRGFLYREMPGGYFARSLRIGLVHAMLTLPVVLLGWGFPGEPAVGALLTLARCLLFGMAALYLRARCESVVPVAIFHGTFLALVHPAIDLTPGAPAWLRPMYGAAGCLGLAVLVAAFAVHDRYFARAKLMFPPRPRSV